MKVLPSSHNTPETAYVIMDYPYGYKARCMKRIWVETATQGKGNGKQRLGEQTSNPKLSTQDNIYWNACKYSTYSSMIILIEGNENNKPGQEHYISNDGIDITYSQPEKIEMFRGRYFDLMDTIQKERFNTLVLLSKHLNKKTWEEYSIMVQNSYKSLDILENSL